jgi:hypothetical protein
VESIELADIYQLVDGEKFLIKFKWILRIQGWKLEILEN